MRKLVEYLESDSFLLGVVVLLAVISSLRNGVEGLVGGGFWGIITGLSSLYVTIYASYKYLRHWRHAV